MTTDGKQPRRGSHRPFGIPRLSPNGVTELGPGYATLGGSQIAVARRLGRRRALG
jgi:hypothetical protein